MLTFSLARLHSDVAGHAFSGDFPVELHSKNKNTVLVGLKRETVKREIEQ